MTDPKTAYDKLGFEECCDRTLNKDYEAILSRLLIPAKTPNTVPLINDDVINILNGAIIAAKESAELLDHIYEHIFYGAPLNHEVLTDEAGDAMYGLATVMNAINRGLGNATRYNVDKLAKRYPEGFTEAAANTQADKNEEQS